MWPVYDGPRPPKLATDLYTRARQQFMRRTAACDGSDQHASEFCQAVDNGGIDGYLDPRLLRGPVHSLRRVAHQMNGPFRAYGTGPAAIAAAADCPLVLQASSHFPRSRQWSKRRVRR